MRSHFYVPEDIDCGLLSVSSSLEEKTSFRRGVRLKVKKKIDQCPTLMQLEVEATDCGYCLP